MGIPYVIWHRGFFNVNLKIMETDYYNDKQKSRLELFKYSLKTMFYITIAIIGYYAWINNHFFLYCFTMSIIFTLRIGYYIGHQHKRYGKIFDNKLDESRYDINNGTNS